MPTHDAGDVDTGSRVSGTSPRAPPPVDALADLFGDAQVAGTTPPVADGDEFGAFQ